VFYLQGKRDPLGVFQGEKPAYIKRKTGYGGGTRKRRGYGCRERTCVKSSMYGKGRKKKRGRAQENQLGKLHEGGITKKNAH